MTQPPELKLNLPVRITGGIISTTAKVWQVLYASYKGNVNEVRRLVNLEPALIFAQYNYTPPVHFAAREGHADLVRFFLANGAYDPEYKTYPFLDTLTAMARDRGFQDIAGLLDDYCHDPSRHRFHGENGMIDFERSSVQIAFEKMVETGDLISTRKMLEQYPEFAIDPTWFWGEGILLFAAKENNREMIDLLMEFGAKVPSVLKWAQFYYLEDPEGAAYMIEKGMDPNTKNWQEVTVLHEMAQKGNIHVAELLLKHGAAMHAIEEEYQSTPLGMAARWGQTEMVEFLLRKGSNPVISGASWSTPLTWARKKGHWEIEELLVEAGAK